MEEGLTPLTTENLLHRWPIEILDPTLGEIEQQTILSSGKFLSFLQRLSTSPFKIEGIKIPWAVVRGRLGEEKFLFGAVQIDATDQHGEKLQANIEIIRGDAVGVIPVVIDKKTRQQYVVLVKQNRLPAGGAIVEIMAGMMDEEKDARAVAARELQEELGMETDPQKLIPLGPAGEFMHTSPGILDERIGLFAYLTEVDDIETFKKSIEQKFRGDESGEEKILAEVGTIEEQLPTLANDCKSLIAIHEVLKHPIIRLAKLDKQIVEETITSDNSIEKKAIRVAECFRTLGDCLRYVGFHQVQKIVTDVLKNASDTSLVSITDQIIQTVSFREELLDRYVSMSLPRFRKEFIENLENDWVILETLRDGEENLLGKKIRQTIPEILGYARQQPSDSLMTQDYASPSFNPPGWDFSLFEKVIERSVGEKLAGLIKKDYRLFNEQDLSREAFSQETDVAEKIKNLGLLSLFKAIVLHLDIAKGGTKEDKKRLVQRLGIDPLRHNEAAALILKNTLPSGAKNGGILENLDVLCQASLDEQQKQLLIDWAIHMVGFHGLIGQKVRGEVTGYVFSDFTDWVRKNYQELVKIFGVLSHGEIMSENLPKFLTDCFHFVNVIDTASVRGGLYTDVLRDQFLDVEKSFQSVITSSDEQFKTSWDDIFSAESGLKEGHEAKLRYFAGRLQKLRAGPIRSSTEPARWTFNTLAGLPEDVFEKFLQLSSHCQQWYTENATSCFTPEDQMKLLFLGMRIAEVSGRIDTSNNYDLSFVRLMNKIRRPDGTYDFWKRKVVEVFIKRLSWQDLMDDNKIRGLVKNNEEISDQQPALTGFIGKMSRDRNVVEVNFGLSEETEAAFYYLNTLRDRTDPLYQNLKDRLCTMYNLKADEWDRVMDQGSYIEGMESEEALSDKAGIAHWFPDEAKHVVSLGAGGGEAEFAWVKSLGTDGLLYAIDISREMVDKLTRIAAEESRIIPVLGDVFKLKEWAKEKGIPYGEIDAIIACAFTHEIYSYCGSEDGKINDELGRQKVIEMYQQAFAALRVGGRLIIRDMMWPQNPEEEVILRLGESIELGEENPLMFVDRFLDEFEGSVLTPERQENIKQQIKELRTQGKWQNKLATLRLTKAEAFEIIYHYSWHHHWEQEKREQYGIADVDTYEEMLVNKLTTNEHGVKVKIAKSYQQKGYEQFLSRRMHLENNNGEKLDYPKGTGIIVLEKTQR